MRLVLLCQVASVATRAVRFPADDDPPDPDGLARLVRRPPRLPRADLILASPSRAAGETAAALTLHPRIEPALRDLEAGRWTARPLPELEASEPAAVMAWVTDPASAPHGGESVAALISRVGIWLAALTAPPRSVLAITHAAVIRAALVHALGADPRAFWRIDVPPLARAHLTGSGDRWTLTGLVPP